jgi:hypothetical protein
MQDLILRRLKQSRATVYWKEYAPAHFGGRTGTWTGVEESLTELDDLPIRADCPSASHGEYW